jgi:ABC-2 type transport system ATP-binding protein
MTPGDPIIEIAELTKVYRRGSPREVRAVDGLDLVLGRLGMVHGFLGPNGSGKTTTIRCLLGLIRPTSGSVRVFGIDSSRRFHEVAPRVGAIVETPKMFPAFSARRNLTLLARLVDIPGSEVDRVLEVVGLADRGDDTYGSYSLGMRQRLAIAGALLKNPDLLILDEPANGLDPAGIAEMRRLIRSIADEGKAILVSSHQLAEVEQICDEVTIINEGRLVETGTLAHIRSFAGDDRVIVTIDERDRAIAALGEVGIKALPRADERELAVEIDTDRSDEVTRALAERGLYLSGLRSEGATLESVFLALTGGAPPPPGMPPGGSGGAPPPTGTPVAPARGAVVAPTSGAPVSPPTGGPVAPPQGAPVAAPSSGEAEA